MEDYIKDMEIRGKYGPLEKKVIMMGTKGFQHLKKFYKE